jgi:hypothetical protein
MGRNSLKTVHASIATKPSESIFVKQAQDLVNLKLLPIRKIPPESPE